MTATYTVTVTRTASKSTYTVTLPNGDCGHAVLVLPVPSCEAVTYDDLGANKTWDEL